MKLSRFWIGFYLCDIITKIMRRWNLQLTCRLYSIAKKIRDGGLNDCNRK